MEAFANRNWQDGKTLTQCNLYMLENEIYDVSFKLIDIEGCKKEPVYVRAMKSVLLSRSKVFFSMFCGELREKKDVIEVTDIDEKTFNQMIRYIYTDEVDITANNVVHLLAAAKKYMLSLLAAKCSEFLDNSITASNASLILDQAIIFKDDSLIASCLSPIENQASEALNSEDFTDISHDALRLILQSNLNGSELEVFQCCIRWAKAKCLKLGEKGTGQELRQALGANLMFIRFPTLSLEEYVEHVVPSGILTESEGFAVYNSFHNKTVQIEMPFSTISRRSGVHEALKQPAVAPLLLINTTNNVQILAQSKSCTITCTTSNKIRLSKVLFNSKYNLTSVRLQISQNGGYLVDTKSLPLPITFPNITNFDTLMIDVKNMNINVGEFSIVCTFTGSGAACMTEWSLADHNVSLKTTPGQYVPVVGIEYVLA